MTALIVAFLVLLHASDLIDRVSARWRDFWPSSCLLHEGGGRVLDLGALGLAAVLSLVERAHAASDSTGLDRQAALLDRFPTGPGADCATAVDLGADRWSDGRSCRFRADGGDCRHARPCHRRLCPLPGQRRQRPAWSDHHGRHGCRPERDPDQRCQPGNADEQQRNHAGRRYADRDAGQCGQRRGSGRDSN